MSDLPEGLYEVPVESVRVRVDGAGRMEVVFIAISKRVIIKKGRQDYFKNYYKNNPDKFKKKKKVVSRERVQDRIDKTFRDEDARLAKIKYAYCQNASCPKPNKKYVAGSGVELDYGGMPLYFCTGRCREAYLAQAIKLV